MGSAEDSTLPDGGGNKPVVAKFIQDRAQYRTAVAHHLRIQEKSWLNSALAVLGVVIFYLNTHSLLSTVIVVAMIPLWSRYQADEKAKLLVQRLPDHRIVTTLETNESGYTVRSFDGETPTKWSEIRVAYRTSDGILLYSGPETFLWLPLNAFACLEDFEKFESRLRANVSDLRTG